ncbi:ABC transporter permease [Microbacterium gorillae]|uniref:ABC transporter permease n=1 Tax=Microbacterium gorillae TaxID=1231063 RepID=UPI00058E2925|nr:ABC transporter permease [Microbacterium gorillae]
MSESTTSIALKRVAPRRRRRGGGLRALWRSPIFLIAIAIITVVVLMAIFPGLFTQIDPRSCDLTKSRVGPEPGHLMGFDIQGCDYWSNIVHGARTSLEVGVLTALLTFIVALIAGSLAGYFGGIVDTAISWLSNMILGIPSMIASLVILYQFRDRTVWTIVLVLVLFGWAGTMRYMRSSVLQVKNLEYIQAARGLGVGKWTILLRHVIPNSVTPLVVMSTLSIGAGMAAESGFSILGVGLRLPAISWGIQIALAGQDGNWQIAPLLMLFPAAMLGLTTLAFVVLGESLRDALDPKARR